MYELEKKCWNEYVKKTSYRRNEKTDTVYIIGLSCIIVTTISIVQNFSNEVSAIVFFVGFMLIYSICELINNTVDKSDRNKEKTNAIILKNILGQNKCNPQNFLLFVRQEKSHSKNKKEKLNNNVNTIFAFYIC